MFVALDFETGGLDPKRHWPVSLAIAVFNPASPEPVVLERDWIIAPPLNKDGKPTREYDICAMQINGMKWKDILGGTPAKVVLNDIREIAAREGLSGMPVIAHNAAFDLAFYSELCHAAGEWNNHTRSWEAAIPPLVGPWQCTKMLAQMQLPTLPNHKLDTVAAHFGLSRTSEIHGAREDAKLAGQIYARMIAGDSGERGQI